MVVVEVEEEEPLANLTSEEQREAEEMREKEREMEEEVLSEDQEHYRRDFLAMLEDVVSIFDRKEGQDARDTLLHT